MPLHEYECEKCGRFERIQKFSDRRLRKCPTCKGRVERLLSAPAIQFKGSGWYVNDYAKKSGAPGKSDNGDKGGKESKSDSSKSESSKADSSKSDSSSGESSSSPKKSTSTDKAASSGSTSTK